MSRAPKAHLWLLLTCTFSDHPLKEIRERALKLLLAKLQLGWQLEDELSGTRQLLEVLLSWFYVQQPTLQREALELLLTTLKVKCLFYCLALDLFGLPLWGPAMKVFYLYPFFRIHSSFGTHMHTQFFSVVL